MMQLDRLVHLRFHLRLVVAAADYADLYRRKPFFAVQEETCIQALIGIVSRYSTRRGYSTASAIPPSTATDATINRSVRESPRKIMSAWAG
jgi:hypothetical protein